MIDKNGNKLSRGTRVMVRFEDHGPEHAPFEWTGKVLGASKIAGRIRIAPEWVTWQGAPHLEAADVTKLADQAAPIQYREFRPGGRIHVAPFELTAEFFGWCRKMLADGGIAYIA